MEQILTLLQTYGYIILIPLAAFEGQVVALVSGFLVYLGIFHIVPVFIIFILGDFVPDVAYYWIGRLGNKKNFLEKYGNKVKIVSDNFYIIERLWNVHSKKTMMASKLAYGLSTPLLISAGLVKLPFKKFALYSFLMSIGQYSIILSLGFFLGHSYYLAAGYIENAGLIVALLVIIIVSIYVFISKRAKKKF